MSLLALSLHPLSQRPGCHLRPIFSILPMILVELYLYYRKVSVYPPQHCLRVDIFRLPFDSCCLYFFCLGGGDSLAKHFSKILLNLSTASDYRVCRTIAIQLYLFFRIFLMVEIKPYLLIIIFFYLNMLSFSNIYMTWYFTNLIFTNFKKCVR